MLNLYFAPLVSIFEHYQRSDENFLRELIRQGQIQP